MSHKASIRNIILILINILILICIIVVGVLSSSKTAVLSILTVPSDALVLINNKEYYTGTYSFTPGTITARIQKDGFDSKEVTLDLKNNINSRLFVYLTKDKELTYTQDSPQDYENLVSISSISDDEFLTSFIKEKKKEESLKNFLPIFYNNAESLQYISFYYETERCKEKNYCILISDTIEGNRSFAISLLEKYGYTSPDYEIIYEYNCKTGDSECARI